MKHALRIFLACALMFGAAGAQAAITCTTITSPGFITSYVAGTTGGLQLSFTITCNRGSTSDPTSISYSVLASNGDNAKGINNRATLTTGGTTYYVGYDVFTPSCGGSQWKGNVSLGGTVSWSSSQTGNATDTQSYWACINSAQSPAASGAYQDTILMTATYNPGTGNTVLTGTIPVTIYAPASCVINPAPGSISIVYPAFSPAPLSSSTTFGATCTAPMPYSMAVAPTTGTLVGVNYNVSLSPASATGTGSLQTYTITVTTPSGQGGTCTGASCTATQTHTLTITY